LAATVTAGCLETTAGELGQSIPETEYADIHEGLTDEIGGLTRLAAGYAASGSVVVSGATEGLMIKATASLRYRESGPTDQTSTIAADVIEGLVVDLRQQLGERLKAWGRPG
jgi:hypothetical protein